MKIARLLFAAFACVLSLGAIATDEAPDQLVKRVADEVLQIVLNDTEIKSGNTERAIALVKEKVVPQFDVPRITASAVGVSWRSATPAQRERLQGEFQDLLVRTYSAALSRVTDQKLEYKPLAAQTDPDRAIVQSLFRQPGAEPVTVDYRMIRKPDGWKVYDVIVAGVSLVTTYRTTFAEEINKGGIDGLVKMLEDKNAALRAGNSQTANAPAAANS